MSKYNLKDIIPLDRLKFILDSISKSTGMNITVLDSIGNILIYPTNDSPLCKCARRDPAICQKCLTLAGHAAFESGRRKSEHVYKCDFGLMDFAVPIYYKDEFIASICGGSIRCDIPHELLNYTHYELSLDNYPELKKIYDNLPQIEPERFLEMINLIKQIAAYIENYGKIIDFDQSTINKATGLNRLQPALDYIHKNYKSEISLHKLASLCCVSSDYFSRLFTKTLNTTLSRYILNFRIAKAKELLQNKSIKISYVAAEVGYDDPSYFVRKFKQITGLTPSEYQATSYQND